MAWEGYFRFDGIEVINAARFQAYANSAGATWFKPAYQGLQDFHRLVGHGPYAGPLADHKQCPWYDRDDNQWHGFYGVYPISVTGIEDSTRSTTVTQSSQDGGVVGRLRHGTRTMVFSVLLAGDDDASVEYGMRWLRNVLLSGTDRSCDGCDGATMDFFYRNPIVGYSAAVADYLRRTGRSVGSARAIARQCRREQFRHMDKVTVTNGPSVTAKNTLSDGSAVWQVQFTAVAASPFEYGALEPVMVDWFSHERHVINPLHSFFDSEGFKYHEVDCDQRQYAPIFDPNCPQLIVPPTAPSLSIGCFDAPRTWQRRTFQIPPRVVPRFTDLVPTLTVQATHEVRNMRWRFWTYDKDQTINDRPCAFLADWLISYIPEGGTLVIDGRHESIHYDTTNPFRSRRADSLVFDSRGLPADWVSFTGGGRHVVAVDMEMTQRPPIINFGVSPRYR